jgi:hypothetical protein
MISLFIGFCVVSVVVGILSICWRVNMAMNDPERYERFRKCEKQFEEDTRAKFRNAYGPLMPGAKKVGGGVVKTLLKKR